MGRTTSEQQIELLQEFSSEKGERGAEIESLKMCLLDPVQQCNNCLDMWADGFGCLHIAVGSGEQQKNMIKPSIIIRVIKQEGLSWALSPKINVVWLCLC